MEFSKERYKLNMESAGVIEPTRSQYRIECIRLYIKIPEFKPIPKFFKILEPFYIGSYLNGVIKEILFG